MTEQPPPSAEAKACAEEIGYAWPAILHDRIARVLDRFAARVCEQRVSAETERCAALVERIAEPEDDSPEGNAAADAFNASPRRDMTQRLVSWSAEVAKAIRAPAERPAPEGPQLREILGDPRERVTVPGAVPSALASTGEQPDKEEDFGKGSV